MTFPEFHNALRILAFGFDRDELMAAGVIDAGDLSAWVNICANPLSFFIRLPTPRAEKVYALIEARQMKGVE